MNIDLIMPVDHFPKTGETVLCAADYLSRTGGKGANQAIAAVRAGGKVAMAGKVGDDAFGRRSVNNLKTQGIWTTGIGISERPTGCATIAVNMKGANIIFVAPGANLDATSDQLPDEVFNSKNLILTQLETDHAQTFDVLRRAKAGGAISILNASPASPIPKETLSDIDYLIVNEIEAHQLAAGFGLKTEDPVEIALRVSAMGSLACIITLEEKGVVAAKDKSVYRIGSMPVEVVDTTGAGDAFCGFFTAALQMGSPWLVAMHFASVGAGLACLGLGAQEGMPAYDDIQANLDKLASAEKIG
jgi:ribokinase